MKTVTANPDLVACCGLYCGACGAYLREKCQGCSQCKSRTWCKVRICCEEKAISTCAACEEFTNPADCKKFNNFISRLIGFITRSDRAACIRQIRETGRKPYAIKMAELKLHAIRK